MKGKIQVVLEVQIDTGDKTPKDAVLDALDGTIVVHRDNSEQTTIVWPFGIQSVKWLEIVE